MCFIPVTFALHSRGGIKKTDKWPTDSDIKKNSRTFAVVCTTGANLQPCRHKRPAERTPLTGSPTPSSGNSTEAGRRCFFYKHYFILKILWQK